MMIHPDVLVDLARQHRDELIRDAAQSRLARAARGQATHRGSVRSLRPATRPQVVPALPVTGTNARRTGGTAAAARVGTLSACAPAAAE